MNPNPAHPLKNRIFSILLFIPGVIVSSSLFGQSGDAVIKFNNISINDGLSQSSPNCIFQDSRGLMWIGTDDGLNKYDGYSFIVYKPEQDNRYSISNSRVLSIAEDASGNLWIGTNGGGINRYDRKSDRFYAFIPGTKAAASVAGLIVSSILALPNGEVWIGTENGLSIFNAETGEFVNPSEQYPSLHAIASTKINTLIQKKDTVVYAGTENGLIRFDLQNKSLRHYLPNTADNYAIPGKQITALLADKDDHLWVGTENGLARMENNDSFTRVRTSAQKDVNGSPAVIKALLQDDGGDLWIGTYGNGVDILTPQTGRVVNYSYDHNNPHSLKNNEVLSIYKDMSGIIWIGSNGIDTYNPKKEKFVLYDYVPYTKERLIFRNIHPIYEDDDAVLWIGSKSDGLHALDRKRKDYGRWVHDPYNQNSLSSNRIRAIKEYPKGILWIGTEDQGLDKIYLDADRKPYRFKHFRSEPGNANSITSNKIYAFFTDNAGKLWIGTDNGLTVMDIETETFKQFVPDTSDPGSLSNTTVYAIYGDTGGNIWLATDYGINKYNPATGGFIHYIHLDNDRNSVIHNEILSFCEDHTGKLWIGTYGKGLDKFDPATGIFTHFTSFSKLSTAVIYGILEDESGRLWLSTNNGIIRFNPDNNEINQFSIEDGLQSNEFNGTSYFKSPSGEMFFGGQYGFNSFFPNDVVIDSVPPKIILSDLQVRNESITPGENSPIGIHINEVKEIVLQYKQNNFTLYFSALHYANPEMNHYKYKLEGFDDDWIDVGNKRFVSYTSLPYKTYTFRVIAANSDGVWNEKGLSVKIRVRPPFWATVWFRFLMILAILSGIFFLIRRQLTVAENQKRIIEEKFRASSKELEEARHQLEIQHSEIVIQKRELKLREKDQENLLWFNQGLGLFSELFSKNRDDLKRLCHVTIEKLVEYVGAQQGGIFLLNDENKDDSFLELMAHYAFTNEKCSKRFSLGEGYVGACFRDKQFLEIDNLTEPYAEFRSGLGGEYLKHLLLAPLTINDECIGVIELGSFKKVKGFRISFIEKLLETFSAIINTERASARLKVLIEKSMLQSKELEASEEQLRVNLEEIMAAQQESAQREDELIKLAEESATHEEMLNQEIDLLKRKIEELTGKTKGRK
jgi:ligand-binding sensor domain-containing protein